MSFVENLVTMAKYYSSNAAPYTALFGKEFKTTHYPNEIFKFITAKFSLTTKKTTVQFDGSKRKLCVSATIFKKDFTLIRN